MSGNRMRPVRPVRTLAAANPRAAVGASTRWPDGDGTAGEPGASNTRGAPAVPGSLESPWHTACLDAVGRERRLLAYPTGQRGLVLKFPPGGSATVVVGRTGLGALLEAVDFASWWRP